MSFGHPVQSQSKIFEFAVFHYRRKRKLNNLWWFHIYFFWRVNQNDFYFRKYLRFNWIQIVIIFISSITIYAFQNWDSSCINEIHWIRFPKDGNFRLIRAMVFLPSVGNSCSKVCVILNLSLWRLCVSFRVTSEAVVKKCTCEITFASVNNRNYTHFLTLIIYFSNKF